MSTGNQTVVPMISYEDGIAALDWLIKAFGFRERIRICDPTGRLMHGELEVSGGLIMLAHLLRTTKVQNGIAKAANLPGSGRLCRGSSMGPSS
jgi:uncharacterized glyoxalase superfamily protein PhnB